MDSPGCSLSIDSFDLPVLDDEPATTSSQKKRYHERPTECSICGKRAHGHHYDVPSCNGCKTFFRRMWISKKFFKCKANGDCFDLTMRDAPVKCRACRYEKCLLVGMNPQAMNLGEPVSSGSNLNRAVKREIPEDDFEEAEKDVLQKKQIIKVLASIENRMQKTIDMLSYLELKLEAFRLSAYNPKSNAYCLEDILNNGNNLGLADRLGPMPGWPLVNFVPPPPPPAPPKGMPPPLYRKDRKLWLFYNLMTTVEYAKTFMFFYQLDMRDRLILIRHVALALMNLHISFVSIGKKFDTIIQPDGTFPIPRDESHYAATVMSVASLIRINIQRDQYVLLKAICLCNPAVPDLSHHAQEILAAERKKYADALFDNCLRSSGPAHYATLLGLMELLERQQRMQKDLHILHIAPLVAASPIEHRIRVIDEIMNN